MQMEFSGLPRQDSQRVLVITRVFGAPRARVWSAWTDPAQSKSWMGPRGFTVTHLEGALRPGGIWRACLRRDDTGEELWQGGTHLEIVPPERLVFSFAWDDARNHHGHATVVTLSFAEQQGRTLQNFRQEMFESIPERDGHRDGWNSTFDRLADYLAGRQYQWA